MTKQIVRTSVPHNLRQLRALLGYHDGRSQISNMLDIAGQNISIENSTLTPDERAYLYYRMQLTSAYEMDGRRETVSFVLVMKNILLRAYNGFSVLLISLVFILILHTLFLDILKFSTQNFDKRE